MSSSVVCFMIKRGLYDKGNTVSSRKHSWSSTGREPCIYVNENLVKKTNLFIYSFISIKITLRLEKHGR